MSLINEALKKAQKMRQVEPAPADAAPAGDTGHAPRVAKRRPAVQAKNVVIATACVVLAFAIAGGVAFTFLLPDTTPPEIVHRPAAKAAPAIPQKTSEPIPTVTAPSFDTPPVASATQAEASSSAAPQSETAAAIATSSPAPADPGATASAPAPAVPEPVANPRVYEFLDTLRVAGIRASATDPKVLMNERVFRLNDIVDRGLGLRITGIAPDALTFTDESGYEYRKHF